MLVACGGDKKDSAPAAADKATADQCKAAYAHLADLESKKNGDKPEDWLATQKGNLDSCPKMVTPKGIDCMNAMAAWDLMKWGDCVKLM